MGKKKSAKQRKIDAAKAKKKAELEAKRNKKKVILKKVETKDSYRSVTGVLTSRKLARDIKIGSFSLISWGNELIMDTNIELTIGRRYGLIGRNGSGKSEFLKCIANREVPIPDWVDLFLLSEEQKPTEFTGMEIVISKAEKEVERLEKLSEEILEEEGPDSPTLQAKSLPLIVRCRAKTDIYDRIETLDPSTFKARAGRILRGLGFGDEMMGKATKDMSGGWRMRVSLAEALLSSPRSCFLDDPTNLLDLESCVWLEQYLATECENQCLVLVSHSQDFLNGVCTNICHITPKKTLKYYGGNYDTFMQVKAEVEGEIKRHIHLSFGRYHQHSVEQLDEKMCPLEFVPKQFPLIKKEEQEWRAHLGRFGISGKLQKSLIGKLSDGQRTRIVFSMLALQSPNMIILDEPTNHLDMESIDSLAMAINKFNGGVFLVSHDFRLIDQVAKEIWICAEKCIKPWKGTIQSYKASLVRKAQEMLKSKDE
eukprot:jgi/Bigna1/90629/estExt_fgenesh1_pg.C_750033